MIPTVFSAAFTAFPRSKQGMVSAMVGLIATLAPTIGPTVGRLSHQRSSRGTGCSWSTSCRASPSPSRSLSWSTSTSPNFAAPQAASTTSALATARRLPRQPRIRARGRPGNDWFQDPTIVILAHRRRRRRHRLLLPARSPRKRADRRAPGLHRPQFRDRLALLLRARHRPLRARPPLSRSSSPACAATTRCRSARRCSSPAPS